MNICAVNSTVLERARSHMGDLAMPAEEFVGK
jgi:hypothetical protein